MCICLVAYDKNSISVAGNVVLTSTVEENGRQFACEGEVVTFMCRVFGSLALQWDSPLIRPVVFVTGFPAPVSFTRPPFTATLTSIAGIGLNTNFTSTLQVNASRMFARNDSTVLCRNLQDIGEKSKFTVSGTCKNEESPKLLFMSQSASYFSCLLHVHICIESPNYKANSINT